MSELDKPHINFYERDTPSFDDNIFCSQCGDYVYEFCSIHGPLLVIPDNEVPTIFSFPSYVPRAALTIPNAFLHLAPSIIPGAGLGVFTTLPLPAGVRFGPYRGTITREPTSIYSWQIYNERNQPAYVVDAADDNRANWMRYVNCSRHWLEQNLLAYQYKGQIYYRTIKIIPQFTELLVFYGSEMANLLNINLRIYNSDRYSCEILETSFNNLRRNHEDNAKIYQTKVERGAHTNDELFCLDTNETNTMQDVNLYNSYQINESQIHLMNTAYGNEIPNEVIEETEDGVEDGTGYNINKKLEHVGEIQSFTINTSSENYALELLSKSHYCEHCGKHFQSRYCLTRHKTTVHRQNKLRCAQCSFTTNSDYLLHRHMLKHNGSYIYNCEICSYSTHKKYYLVKHQRVVHKFIINVLHCNHCGYKTTDKTKLNHHLSTHTALERLECEFCEFITNKKKNMRRHVSLKHISRNQTNQ